MPDFTRGAVRRGIRAWAVGLTRVVGREPLMAAGVGPLLGVEAPVGPPGREMRAGTLARTREMLGASME